VISQKRSPGDRHVVSAASRSTELPQDPVLSGVGVPWQDAQRDSYIAIPSAIEEAL
jgi:hypothetical protein